MKYIKYNKTYKYKLSDAEYFDLSSYITDSKLVHVGGWCALDEGMLIIYKGYAWDGASGPAIDTPDFMLGSLVHDAMYQLMREGILDQRLRKVADQVLYDICKDAGMPWWRAQYVYWAVRMFGAKNARPGAFEGQEVVEV